MEERPVADFQLLLPFIDERPDRLDRLIDYFGHVQRFFLDTNLSARDP